MLIVVLVKSALSKLLLRTWTTEILFELFLIKQSLEMFWSLSKRLLFTILATSNEAWKKQTIKGG